MGITTPGFEKKAEKPRDAHCEKDAHKKEPFFVFAGRVNKILTEEDRTVFHAFVRKLQFGYTQFTHEEKQEFQRLYSKIKKELFRDCEDAEDIARQLVEMYKNFDSSVQIPSPSDLTGDDIDDIAAVIAGRKPAAIVYGNTHELIHEQLLYMAMEHGYTAAQMCGRGENIMFIVGKPRNVADIIELLTIYRKQNISDEKFHKRLGVLLGYSEEAISYFLEEFKKSGV